MIIKSLEIPKKCKIIAEIGINHNGDIKLAKQLIDISKKVGCDAVKFQKRTIDIVYSENFLKENGRVILEIGINQQEKIIEFFTKNVQIDIENYLIYIPEYINWSDPQFIDHIMKYEE